VRAGLLTDHIFAVNNSLGINGILWRWQRPSRLEGCQAALRCIICMASGWYIL